MKKNSWVIISLVLVLVSQTAFTKNYYRFKNANGSVEIKDKITKEMELAGYDVISLTGKLLKHVEPTKTLAQLDADRLLKIEERNKKIEFQQQLRKDADLLRQFTSIGDIIRNRDSQLLALEQRIRIQHSKEDLLHLQLEDQQQQAATYERLGKKVALSVLKDIDSSLDQIASNRVNTRILQKEKYRVEKSFEKDIVRYKDLESVRLSLRKDARERDEMAPVLFDCKDEQVCNRAWQLAQIYARDNTTGKIEIITNSLILTSRPVKNKDIAISFSKIPAPDNKKQIVLEVSCMPEEAGVTFCKTQKVKDIRKDYLEYLKLRLAKN
ncbi:MAG: hypothetical protein L3J46_04580 [Kangiellaceae bacterium]|nr:hypothetical protein [Kangiellaceae bacterium]